MGYAYKPEMNASISTGNNKWVKNIIVWYGCDITAPVGSYQNTTLYGGTTNATLTDIGFGGSVTFVDKTMTNPSYDYNYYESDEGPTNNEYTGYKNGTGTIPYYYTGAVKRGGIRAKCAIQTIYMYIYFNDGTSKNINIK